MIGGTLGWLAGVEGRWRFRASGGTAAGPIVAALAGIGVAHSGRWPDGSPGGSTHCEYEAERYEGRV